MAGEAEVLVGAAGHRLQQLVLVVRSVRIVTLEAIADRRRMDRAFQVGSLLVGMAGQTKCVWSCGDQLHASDILVHSHFVATGAAGRDGRVHELALGFVLMTLDTLGGVSVLVQRHGMGGRAAQAGAPNQAQSQKQPYCPHKLPPHLRLTICASRMPSPARPQRRGPDGAKLLFRRELDGRGISPLAPREGRIETRGMGFPPHAKVKSPTNFSLP